MKVDFSISACISICIYKSACIYIWLLTLKGMEFGVVFFICFSFLLETDVGERYGDKKHMGELLMGLLTQRHSKWFEASHPLLE